MSERAYSLRLTGLSNRTDDFEFRWEGKSVGRTYAQETPQGPRWYWTIYGTAYRGVVPEDVSVQGLVTDLAEAKTKFKTNFEKLIATGCIRLPATGNQKAP